MSIRAERLTSEEIKALAGVVEKLLARAVTYRKLFELAYNYLSVSLEDYQMGQISSLVLFYRHAVLKEQLVTHMNRIKTITAVTSPNPSGPRWSELER